MIHGLSQMYSLGGALYNFVLLLAFGSIISSIPNLRKILEHEQFKISLILCMSYLLTLQKLFMNVPIYSKRPHSLCLFLT